MNSNDRAATSSIAQGVRLYGALCVQRGTPMLQSYADPLAGQGHIDVHDPETDTGYQRTLVTARIKQTADYYEKDGERCQPAADKHPPGRLQRRAGGRERRRRSPSSVRAGGAGGIELDRQQPRLVQLRAATVDL